jgi:hypothetical protein
VRDAAVAATIVSPFQLLGHERGRSTGFFKSENSVGIEGCRPEVHETGWRVICIELGRQAMQENAVFCLDGCAAGLPEETCGVDYEAWMQCHVIVRAGT